MERQVMGCNDCPMFSEQEWDGVCGHPYFDKNIQYISYDDSDLRKGLSPEWCPLKKEPITITIKPK